MSLADRIQNELTAAIRGGDVLRRDTLRMVSAALYGARKTARRELTEDEVLTLVTRELKTRRESVDAYEKASRPDLAAKEEAEIAILQGFLPAALSQEELRAMVREAIAETGAAGPRDLGRVMKVLSPRTRGRADGRLVSEMVNAELAGEVETGEVETGEVETGEVAAGQVAAEDPS